MHEITINLHMHTKYSDGTGLHADLAQAAIKAGIDAIIVTDHNIWVHGMEKYYSEGDQESTGTDRGRSPRPGSGSAKEPHADLQRRT